MCRQMFMAHVEYGPKRELWLQPDVRNSLSAHMAEHLDLETGVEMAVEEFNQISLITVAKVLWKDGGQMDKTVLKRCNLWSI